MIRALHAAELRIPFTMPFRHASAVRHETSTMWVIAAADGGAGYGEGCPRPYVTGETLETAHTFFARYQHEIMHAVSDMASLRAWVALHTGELDRSPAAWCAIELALLDALGRAAGRTIESLLGCAPLRGPFHYSAVIGDAEPGNFARLATRFARVGFTDYKVRLSGSLDRDRAKMALLRSLDVPDLRLRVDANNLWDTVDEAVRYLRRLDHPLLAIEEPLTAGRFEDLARIGDALATRIVLDESLVRLEQLACLRDHAERWIVNIRVSKMGGLLRSLALVDATKRAGVPAIIGAQVGETSVLTRAGLTIAAACGDHLLAHEGAFGTHLLLHDVCDRPLMFSARGVLDPVEFPALREPGLGIAVSPALAPVGPS
jgi:L-alanine-DL-glutamate epimerase-like enolase superfamily enzyme